MNTLRSLLHHGTKRFVGSFSTCPGQLCTYQLISFGQALATKARPIVLLGLEPRSDVPRTPMLDRYTTALLCLLITVSIGINIAIVASNRAFLSGFAHFISFCHKSTPHYT